jgi:hypothetical protein
MSSTVTKLTNVDFAKICIAVDRFREHGGRYEAINTINAIIAPKTAQESIGPTLGIELIAAERKRQIEVEGWTSEHDDEHKTGEMARAARCYAQTAYLQVCGWAAGGPERTWPWNKQSWKPADYPIRNLIKAGALIAAEIDRIQRSKALSR